MRLFSASGKLGMALRARSEEPMATRQIIFAFPTEMSRVGTGEKTEGRVTRQELLIV